MPCGGLDAACPVVGTSVFSIGSDPVEGRDFVERNVPRQFGILLIGEWTTKFEDAACDGVLPRCVAVGIKRFIDGRIRLLNLRIGARGKVEVNVFSRIPTELEATIPQEVAREGERKRLVL